MKTVTLSVLMTMFLFSPYALAENMNCAGGIVQDKLRKPMTSDQVRNRCGEPGSKEGNAWIYTKGAHLYRLLFDDSGNLYAIHKRANK